MLKSLPRAWIKSLAFAPNGTAIAAAAGSCGLLLWSQLLNGKKAEVLKVSVREVDRLAFTPDGECLFGSGCGTSNEPGSMQTELCAIRLTTREVTRFPVECRSVRFAPTPDSTHAIVCETQYDYGKETTRNTCRSLHEPGSPKWEVVDESIFPFGPFFVNADHFLIGGVRAGGKDFCLRTRSASTGALVSEVSGASASPDRVILSPDATRIASVSNVFLHVQPVSGPLSETPVARNDNRRHFVDLAFHPSGKYLALASNDETVKFFDTTTWEIAHTFTWKIGKMRAVCFSPDGTLAAAGGEKGQVVVWDVDL